MTRSALDKERLTAEAAEWLTRLNEQKVGNATRGHFVLWLLRSWQHLEAFLLASRVYGAVGFVKTYGPREELAQESREQRPDANVVPIRGFVRGLLPEDEDQTEPRTHRTVLKYSLAASIVAAFLGIGLISYHPWSRPDVYKTGVGEQRSVMLDDGTTVYLNTATTLTAKMSASDRSIVLIQGEARFTVAKDLNRPFLVTTPQAVVRAVGTAFNVRIIGERTVVSVIEGHIKVLNRRSGPAAAGQETSGSRSLEPEAAEAKQAIELFANEQVSVTQAGRMDNGGPPFDRATGWTARRIVFHEEPLAVVAAEFNRYNEQPLVIPDPELAQHRIDGGFDTFDRTTLLEYLRRFHGVRVEEAGGKLIMRRDSRSLPAR